MGDSRQLGGRLVAFLDLVARVYLAPITLLASAIFIAVNYFTVGSYYVYVTFFAVLSACVLYLAIRRRLTSLAVLSVKQLSPRSESRVHKVLTILFFCVVTICIFLLSETLYSRPPAFFVLSSLLAGLIATEIAISSDTRHVPSVLIKTIILGVILRASVYFEFPSTLGTDPWWHNGFVQYVLDSGHIPTNVPQYSSLEYVNMPMMHLFVSGLTLVSGLNLHISYFFVGVIECLSVIFIFLIGKAVMGERSGLLAALLLVLASQFVLWGFYIAPMTFGVVLTLVVLCAVFLVPRRDFISFAALILVVFAGIMLTHEGTAAYTAVALVAILLTFAFIRVMARVSNSFENLRHMSVLTERFWALTLLVLLFIGSLIGYWIFIGGGASARFFAIVRSGFSATTPLTKQINAVSSGGVSAAVNSSVSAVTPRSLPLLNDLAVLLFIFFATLGLLWILSKERKNALTMSWFGSSALILLITAVIYFAGGGQTLPERWIVYLQVFAAIPAAVGVLALGTLSNRRKGLAIVFAAVLLVSFVSLNSTTTKIVNELPWDNRARIALEQSEISAAGAIANRTNGGSIKTDFEYGQIFAFQLHASNVSRFNSLSGSPSLFGNSTLVLRNYLADNPYLTDAGTSAPLGADHYSTFEEAHNVVYDAGTVQVVTAKT